MTQTQTWLWRVTLHDTGGGPDAAIVLPAATAEAAREAASRHCWTAGEAEVLVNPGDPMPCPPVTELWPAGSYPNLAAIYAARKG